jgi:phospholipid/cholesterol/gamma-HCH transport system permease protein
MSTLKRLSKPLFSWLSSWWNIVLFGVTVLAMLPSSLVSGTRNAVARQIVRATAPNLMWFTILSALISIVLIRIVVVTALSYGLSRFAIEMVVRVLVLELIPLTAALFVALRYALPESAELGRMRTQGTLEAMREHAIDPMRQEFLPRVLASVFCVWMLGAVSCIMTLLLAYLTIYGFTPWAFPGYTRVVGHVFNPAVTLILVLKIFFFSVAVSFIPMASTYYHHFDKANQGRTQPVTELAAMVRLFAVVLLIEVTSLMGNYY